jgi:hypothetical protein
MFWPFRSTRDRIAELRELRRPAPETAWPWSTQEPPRQLEPDHGSVYVSADAKRHLVSIRIIGLGYFDMSRTAAFALAKKIEGAADALGPEPTKADVAVDITDQVGKEEDGG